MSIFKPVTLITGASSGIGSALARVFAEKGHQIAMVARREQPMTLLAAEIAVRTKVRPHVLPIDLGRADAPARISHELLGRGLEPQIVVNNAGFGLVGAAGDLDRSEQLAMIDLNVRALTDLSLRWVESLARHQGGILNVASVAGFLPGPGMAVYYATKAYVLSFSEALHEELKPRGIRVTALCPGPVPTEFQGRAGVASSAAPKLFSVTAEKVARTGYDALRQGRAVAIPGAFPKVLGWLPRLAPRGMVRKMVHARQQARPKVEGGWPRRSSKSP